MPERYHAHLLERIPTPDAYGIERGDGSAGKVERISVDIHYDLNGVAVNVFFPGADPARQVYAVHGWVLDHGPQGGGDLARRDHRLVPLDHHNDIRAERCRRLGDAVTGSLVSGRCHKNCRAEAFSGAADLLIACRDVNRVEDVAHRGPPKYVLDHRSSQNP